MDKFLKEPNLAWIEVINKLADDKDFRDKVVKVLNTTVSKEEDVS